MKIKLPQQKLSNALTYASRAVSVKPNIPVLANILIEVNKTELHVASTNLDMGINMWISGQVDSEGSVTVSGKFITDFVAATGAGNVSLELEGDNLVVSTEGAQAKFQTISAGEFPIIPESKGDPVIVVKSEELRHSLSKVLFACATDLITSRIQHTGVLFEFDPESAEQLTLVGLDGYRMSRKFLKLDSTTLTESMQMIVPAKSLLELSKILQTEEVDTCEIFLSDNKSQIIFKIGDIEITIRLLEGNYAEYKKVIPVENSFTFEVAKSDLEKIMRVTNTFARSTQGNRVDWDLDLESTTLTMQSTVSDLGTNITQVKVQNVGGSNDFKAAYSLQFLLDMIAHVEGDTVEFATNGPLAAACFTDPSDKDYLHIIMPLLRE